jgi:hypothetical protein
LGVTGYARAEFVPEYSAKHWQSQWRSIPKSKCDKALAQIPHLFSSPGVYAWERRTFFSFSFSPLHCQRWGDLESRPADLVNGGVDWAIANIFRPLLAGWSGQWVVSSGSWSTKFDFSTKNIFQESFPSQRRG